MDCVYLAAGLGQRMKEDIPKQFLPLYGKPIIVYALEVIASVPSIEHIYLVCHKDFMDYAKKILKNYRIERCTIIEGGATRQESVQRGLTLVSTPRVLIHEAARPIITADLISRLMEPDDPAIIPTVPVPFTVSLGNKYMTGELDRSMLHNIQLPQIFDTEILRQAHKKANQEGFVGTEDGILVYRAGYKVRFIPGDENNIKVTTPLDRILVERIMVSE